MRERGSTPQKPRSCRGQSKTAACIGEGIRPRLGGQRGVKSFSVTEHGLRLTVARAGSWELRCPDTMLPAGSNPAGENMKLIPASPEHERRFRQAFRLRDHLANDPIWQMAFEHAAKFQLYPDELTAIGAAIERKPYYEPDVHHPSE